jgi:prevent-host-death family protein
METVGAYEAKTHLPRLLERVAKGETITITKHGVPVARLVPVEETARRDVTEVIEEIRRFRKERPLEGVSAAEIKDMINEGRRL